MKNPWVILAGVLGLILLGLAFVYFTTPANALPNFLPGYDPSLTTHHAKHGIGAALLGIAAFIYAWFQSKPKTSSADK